MTDLQTTLARIAAEAREATIERRPMEGRWYSPALFALEHDLGYPDARHIANSSPALVAALCEATIAVHQKAETEGWCIACGGEIDVFEADIDDPDAEPLPFPHRPDCPILALTQLASAVGARSSIGATTSGDGEAGGSGARLDGTISIVEHREIRGTHREVVLPAYRADMYGRPVASPSVCGRCNEPWPCAAIQRLEADIERRERQARHG